MGTTAEKLTYLNETKTKLKDMLNLGGASLTTEPFRQYVDTLKNRYLYFMNNGTDVVWNNWEKVVGEGTTITLNNTEEAPMTIDLKGNTSQEGTPTPESPQDIHVVSGDNSIEVCGKNLFDESKLTLATEVVDGKTCYKIAGINTGTANRIWDKQLKENTQYTISMVAKKVQYFNIIYIKYTDGTTSSKQFNNTTFETISVTSTAGKTIEYITIDTGANAATNYIEVGTIQLEEGTTATTYESYTGASYPINLPVENILDITSSGSSIGGVPFTIENGIIKINGTTSSSTASYYFNTFRAKSESAVFSIEVTGYTDKSSGNSALILQQSDDGTTGWSTLSELSLNSVYAKQNSVTLDSSKYYRLRWYVDNNTFTNATIKAQLEYGNKKNSFTPYGTTPIELCKIRDYQDSIKKSTGKNLFDKDSQDILENVRIGADGGNNADSGYFISEFIEITPNTKYTKNTTADAYHRFAFYTDKSINSFISKSENNTITTPNNAKYLRICGLITEKNTIMLNEGTTALPYEPYGTSWYVKKEIGKVVLDGSETGWAYSSTNTNFNIRPYSLGMRSNNMFTGYIPKVCSHFKYFASNGNQPNLADGIYENVSTSNISFLLFHCDSLNITTLESWQTWLSTNKPIIYYVLETPTYTLIEDSTLIEELESMKKSYENQTNISQENNDLASILNATALEEMS